MAIRKGFYPVIIHETRYSGAYSGGQWALIAGLHNPDERLEAFGADGPCGAFWNRVRDEGPFITVPYNGKAYDEQDIYVASGNDPAELVEEFKERTEGRGPNYRKAPEA